VKRCSPKGSTHIKNLKTTVLGEQHAIYGQQKKSIRQAVTFGYYVITTRIRIKNSFFK